MTNKKLGLFLLPLLPLSAIGIVEVANAIVRPEPVAVEVEPECRLPTRPTPSVAPPSVAPQHVAPAAPDTQIKA